MRDFMLVIVALVSVAGCSAPTVPEAGQEGKSDPAAVPPVSDAESSEAVRAKAELGNANAQCRLGEMYAAGEGVSKNSVVGYA